MNTNQAIARISMRASWLSMLVLMAVAACSTNAQAVSTPTTIARLAATGIAVPTASATYVLPPTRTAIPTADDRITQAFVATVLTARSAAGATANCLGTQLAETTLVVPTGILDGPGVRADAHYLNVDAIFENMWRGELSDHVHSVDVYAGSSKSDPTQGLVVVIVEGPVIIYLSPVKAGTLHIVAEQNLRLTLLSTNGTTFYFDVPGQQFVPTLTQVVPTVTPFAWPTGTPTPVPRTAAPVPSCTPGPTPSHATGEPDCLAY